MFGAVALGITWPAQQPERPLLSNVMKPLVLMWRLLNVLP